MAVQLALCRRCGMYVLAFLGLSFFLVSLYREFGAEILRNALPIQTGTPSPLQPPRIALRSPCAGPRGRPVQENRDDQIWAERLDLRTSYMDHIPGSS